MHDLLRDMGREIIHEKHPNELGKWSRLWLHEDAFDILAKHKVIRTFSTENIERKTKHFFLLLRYMLFRKQMHTNSH